MAPDLLLFPTLQLNITNYPHKHFAMLPAFPLLGQGSESYLCLKFHILYHPHPLEMITNLEGPTYMTINSMQAFSVWVGCGIQWTSTAFL